MLLPRYSKLYNPYMFEWSDLRHFLAIARSGSTLAAARSLRVSQPTVVRRIAALEEALGLSLFDRRPSGYRLTEAGLTLVERSERVEAAAKAVHDAALSQVREISGTVRISLFEIFGVTVLPPLLRELRETHPQIRVDVDLSDVVRDLEVGEADIALRSGVRLSGNGLVCRRVCDERWAYYCSADYLKSNIRPTTPDMMRDHPLIGDGTEDFWPEFAEWRRAAGLSNTSNFRGSANGLLAAVKSGMGIASAAPPRRLWRSGSHLVRRRSEDRTWPLACDVGTLATCAEGAVGDGFPSQENWRDCESRRLNFS